MNNGRNSHERKAIGKAIMLFSPDQHFSRHTREQLVNSFVMHCVNAAKAEIEAERRKEVRREEALEYVIEQQHQ